MDDPILWLHGEEDQLVPMADTKWDGSRWPEGMRPRSPTPGARHEIFNETNQDEVLDDVIAFIRANLPAQGAASRVATIRSA